MVELTPIGPSRYHLSKRSSVLGIEARGACASTRRRGPSWPAPS